MNRAIKGIGLLISLLFVSSFSACKYGSLMEAQIACDKWADERKGKIEVDDDGDGKKGEMVENPNYEIEKFRYGTYQMYKKNGITSIPKELNLPFDVEVVNPPQKYIHVDGTEWIDLRRCSWEENTQQFIGIEYITPYEELISKEKYNKLEIRYNKFPY